MEQRTAARTTADDRQFWVERGHLSLIDLLPTAAVDSVKDAFDGLFDRFEELSDASTHRVDLPDGKPGSLEIVLATELDRTLRDTEVFRSCHEVASELLDCKAQFFFDHVIRKPAEVGTGTAWHQDRAYNLVEPQRDRVHFWVPMADVDATGGCMQFVPGSHRRDLVAHRPVGTDPTKHVLEAVGDYDPDAVAVPLRAGSVSIHHQMTMHKTGANLSPHTRTAWILHFIRPRTVREQVSATTRRFRPAQPTRL